jgi:hypothetical protein
MFGSYSHNNVARALMDQRRRYGGYGRQSFGGISNRDVGPLGPLMPQPAPVRIPGSDVGPFGPYFRPARQQIRPRGDAGIPLQGGRI